jgi:hypothetical protein
MWWDEISAMYDKYRCPSVRVSVTWNNRTSTGLGAFNVVGFYPRVSTSTSSTYQQACEFTRGVHKNVGANAGNQGVVTLTRTYHAHQEYGVPRDFGLYDDVFSASVTSLPSRAWYIHVFGGALDGSTTPAMDIIVNLSYRVQFFDKKLITISLTEEGLSFDPYDLPKEDCRDRCPCCNVASCRGMHVDQLQ